MHENRNTSTHRWGGPGERARCLREAQRYLQPADAEDAVQEALLRAWRKKDAWISPDGPLPWLLTITRNEALRLRARRHPAPVGAEADVTECAQSRKPLLDDLNLDQALLRADLKRSLDRLSADDRVLLQLYYTGDFAQAVLARHLGIPEATVKKRLHRARTRLRRILIEELESAGDLPFHAR